MHLSRRHPYAGAEDPAAPAAGHVHAREVTAVKITMTSTTYLSELPAATMRAAGAGMPSVVSCRERRGAAPVSLRTQRTSASPFNGDAGSVQLMNKSIVSFPHTDAVDGDITVTHVTDLAGASGIRSWSPPV